MRILRLEATNIQRLSAVAIEPNGDPVLVLAGENGEGKSSCLDAIEMALGGEKTLPPEPIRRGEEKASVRLDLGDLIVTRRFTAGGKGSITVTNREGLKYPSPQALLDGLYSKLTFDPLAFSTAKPADQAQTLRALARLDTTDLEMARQTEYDARTDVNRDLARSKAVLAQASAVTYPDVGTEPEDPQAIIAELAAADRLAAASAEAERKLAAADSVRTSAATRLATAQRTVETAKKALKTAEKDVATVHAQIEAAEADWREKADLSGIAEQAVPDREALRTKLSTVQIRNEQIKEAQRRVQLAKDVAAHQAAVDAHTTRITTLDAEKAERLAAAAFPVEGLGLDDTGVTWQGLPFEQASTAVRTRVSVAIGLALHPRLKVLLVRNGNDLDNKSLKLIAETAEAAGAQLWIERIAGGNGLQTIVIEDGAVKEMA